MNTIESINGTALPIQPNAKGGYKVTTYDLDSESSGRSAETGVLLRYVIRKNVHKISLAFRGRKTDIQAIKSLVSATRLTVKFYDAGDWITAEMYVGDRSSEPLPVIGQEGWYDYSFDLIEY